MRFDQAEIDRLAAVLTEDIRACEENLDGEQAQFWRRAFVRGAFGLFEGFAASLREMLAHPFSKSPMTVENAVTFLCLTETGVRLDHTGKVDPDTLRLKFSSHLAFTLRLYARSMRVNDQFYSENGWHELNMLVRVRDRLMHPKRADDLLISDEEIELADRCLTWFNDVISRIKEAGCSNFGLKPKPPE